MNKKKFRGIRDSDDSNDECYSPSGLGKDILEVSKLNKENCVINDIFKIGGDYEKYDYDKSKIYIDNPPFSKIKEIFSFFVKNNIKFIFACNGTTCYYKWFLEQDDIKMLKIREVVDKHNRKKSGVMKAYNFENNGVSKKVGVCFATNILSLKNIEYHSLKNIKLRRCYSVSFHEEKNLNWSELKKNNIKFITILFRKKEVQLKYSFTRMFIKNSV